MCAFVPGSFRFAKNNNSSHIYLFAIHESVSPQTSSTLLCQEKVVWKIKGTENHNQNTDWIIHTLSNAKKKKKNNTYHNTHAATVAMVVCSIQISYKREKIRTWESCRVLSLLHYILYIFFRFARMLAAVLSFIVLGGVCRKVGRAVKRNRTWNTKTQSNTKKLCKI